MAACMTVLEYDYLRRASPTRDGHCRIPPADFEALRSLLVDDATGSDVDVEHHRLFRLCTLHGEEALQVRNMVGVLEAPSGLQIEILPKIGGSPEKARDTLVRMLRVTRNIPALPAYNASLRPVNLPLAELFLREFLEATNKLLKTGIVSGYGREQRNKHFLKGRLLMTRQLQHNVARADRFYVEYDQFLVDRAENRLICSCLERVASLVRDQASQRLCRELQFAFDDAPPSKDFSRDFEMCTRDRSLAHYVTPLAWARLILMRLSPLGRQGNTRVRALLFPMEKVFEQYVGHGLRRELFPPDKLHEQVHKRVLVTHKEQGQFQLRPDFLVERHAVSQFVLDAKWKRLNSSEGSGDKKYGILQSDLYQLFAYGHKYLSHKLEAKVVCLIYPMTEIFNTPLAPFEFDPGYQLLVLPFDLDNCRLIGGAFLRADDATFP